MMLSLKSPALIENEWLRATLLLQIFVSVNVDTQKHI